MRQQGWSKFSLIQNISHGERRVIINGSTVLKTLTHSLQWKLLHWEDFDWDFGRLRCQFYPITRNPPDCFQKTKFVVSLSYLSSFLGNSLLPQLIFIFLNQSVFHYSSSHSMRYFWMLKVATVRYLNEDSISSLHKLVCILLTEW